VSDQPGTFDFKRDRIQRGYSPQEMADEIGVARSTYVAVEDGAIPSPRTRRKFAAFYELEILELWPTLLPAAEASAA
jgi:DNA-binding XRE family transcriptional regulator